ncbi:MAG: DUF1343 domain-containing protein [Peptoniphilus sp.]|nr:DUF1343 domain-containing protein [Peptoniphilus sp.]MDD7363074.1 DUF1343 domain-containing protein [Bacillota bacterium]MDY6044402.1 DUF1343 domain-containing protein [Peptoniphilus sp.]
MKKTSTLWILLVAFCVLLVPTGIEAKTAEGVRSPQALRIDGEMTNVRGYNIGGYNYYRLRDLARVLRGKVDFSLEGDNREIRIDRSGHYTTFQGDVAGKERETAHLQQMHIKANGEMPVDVVQDAYNIAGFNYFRLRNMEDILGITVTYDEAKNEAVVHTSDAPNAPGEETPPEQPQEGRVILGNERLFSEYAQLIDGKRVGLITNQTGVDANGVPVAKKLKDDPNTTLVALYSPEHGLDGKQTAGKYVESYYDKNMGLPVYSLYGPTRKPSKAMLKGVDVLLYDMQDIGARTYTYISTLQNAMLAAKENNIPIVVLDRPNPLGGEIVEGFLRETRFKSFVGIDKMPMAHGMTAGELGRFFNREIGADLTVVPLKNWTRDMVWQDTGLPFAQTSPNIPDLSSAFLYMATGSGEETGIGQDEYFHWVGGKNLNSAEYARRLNASNLPGVRFVPAPKGSRGGVRLEITDWKSFNPARTGVYTLAVANQMRPINVPPLKKPYSMFYLVQGSEQIAQMFKARRSPEDIVKAYQADVQAFKAQREPYLLYK